MLLARSRSVDETKALAVVAVERAIRSLGGDAGHR